MVERRSSYIMKEESMRGLTVKSEIWQKQAMHRLLVL